MKQDELTGPALFEEFYHRTKKKFLSSVRHWGIEPEIVKDIYHDSMLKLLEMDLEKVENVESFLLTICWNKLKSYSTRSQQITFGEMPQTVDAYLDSYLEKEDKAKAVETTYQLLLESKEDCREILALFYYYNNSMEEIANELNYANSNSAKTKKSNCLRKFELVLIERLKKIGINWRKKK